MNPFVNVFTDSVDFDQVEWDDFTSLIATTDDIKLLLSRLNETASYSKYEDDGDWALRMYAWVMAMTNNELFVPMSATTLEMRINQYTDKGDK